MTVEDQLAALFGEVQTYYYIIKDTPTSTWRSAIDKHKGVDKKLPSEWSPVYKAWYYGLPLTKATIKSAYKNAQETGKEIGRRPSSKNNYAAFDVDSPIEGKRDGSAFHPENSLAEWSRLIMFIKDRIGVDIVVVRSSSSNGYHIYVFFDQWMSSDRIAHRIKEILAEESIEIAQGQLEIFPNIRESDDAKFNGLRLPCLTEESYVVDPFTLERVGGREAFVELAAKKNSVDLLLGREKPAKPILATKDIKNEPVVVEAVEVAINFEDEDKPKWFNLGKRFRWSETNRSNRVIGAHVAYVIEQMGLTDPTEIETVVWERLHEYGYRQNASKDELKDRNHVRRWISTRLKKGDVAPLAKVTGPGDARLNEQRSEDSKFRFQIAIEAAKKAGETFPSWNQMFKWVNRWLSQQYLATIGSSTWEKLKQNAITLLTPHTVDYKRKGLESHEDTVSQGSPSPSKPAFKSVFVPTVLELGQKFVESVAQVMGGDRTYAPKVVQYLLDNSPHEALAS
jgi:hypothetical protein